MPLNRHRRRICFPINYNLFFEVIIVATEYKDCVSVRKEILMKIQNYIEFGCYEQAVEMLDDLCDDNERRKAQERKKTLYFNARKAETPEEKKRAWAAYYSFMDSTIF